MWTGNANRPKAFPEAIHALYSMAYTLKCCAKAASVADWKVMATSGYCVRWRYHELCIGDPNRSAPEKLKTILRQPVEKVTG